MVCRVELDVLTHVPTDILTVKALDNDTQKYNSEVYYSVTTGQDVVTVNRTTGVVTLHKHLSAKYKQLAFTISARDGGSPQRTNRTKLTIIIKILSGETFLCLYPLRSELCYWLRSCVCMYMYMYIYIYIYIYIFVIFCQKYVFCISSQQFYVVPNIPFPSNFEIQQLPHYFCFLRRTI